jgi:hypothetical protein
MEQADLPNSCEDEMKETGIQLLMDWFVSTVQALIDAAGSSVALERMKQYGRHHGMAGGLIFRKNMGLTGSDAIAIATTMQACNMALGVGIEDFKASSELAVANVTSCLYEGCPIEACEALCHTAGKGWCEGFSSEFDFDTPYLLTRGDSQCLWVIRRKSRTYTPRDLRVESLAPVPRPSISKEDYQFWTAAALGERWVISTKAFVDFSGSRTALGMLKPYFRQSGLSFGINYSKRLNIDGNDARAVSRILDWMNSCMGQTGSTIWSSADEVEKVMTYCPFSGSPSEICSELEAFTNGICEAINPEYELTHTKAMCRGDETCRRVVRKKRT